MRKTFLLLFCLLPLFQLSAQEKSDRISLIQLVRDIKEHTDLQVYSLASDTLKVLKTADYSVDGIRRSLHGTNIQVAVLENNLFLLPDKPLLTDLTVFRKDAGDNPDTFIPEVIASNENQIYEVGAQLQPARQQKIRLQGTVCNFRTGAPLEGIQIICRDPWETALTGTDGSFSLELPVGYHVLELKGMDIQDTQRRFQLYADGIARIELGEDARMLDEIVIQAGRVAQVHSTQMGVEKFNPALLKNLPSAMGEADVLKMLQTLPGVKTVGEASNGFNVRGGATDQNLILFNNGTIFNPNHMFGLFTAFNSDMVNEAELYKSSIPAKYGGRISSVLNISSKEADKEKASGSASIGLLTAKLNLELPLVRDKLSLQLNGRMTYSDWMLKTIPEKSGYRNGKAGFHDMGGVLSWNMNTRNKLNVYGYYSHDRFSFTESEAYGYTNLNVSGEWKSFFSDSFTGEFAAGYDHYDYLNDVSESPDMYSYYSAYNAYRLSFAIHQVFGKAHFNWEAGERHQVGFGLNVNFDNVHGGKMQPLGSLSTIQSDELEWDNALESALYLSDQYEITPRWSVEGGVRLSIYNVLGPRHVNSYMEGSLPSDETLEGTTLEKGIIKTYMGPEFRLSTRYRLKDDLSIKAGFNTMRQYFHKVSNTSIMSPTDIWKLSDSNIKPQEGWQVAAGVYHESPRRNWEYSLEAYYKRLDNYLDYRNGAELLMNDHLETDVISTQGYAYGIELQAKKMQGKLTGWASYSYSRTFIRQHDPRVAMPVNNGEWYPTEYDRPHEFKMAGNYKLTQRFSMSANLDYSTGRPITIPAGTYFDKRQNRPLPYYIDRNSYRIPDYMRLDLSFNLDQGHHRTRKLHTSYTLGVYNALARRNVYNIYYVSEPSGIKGYQLSIFGSAIPYLTVNLNF